MRESIKSSFWLVQNQFFAFKATLIVLFFGVQRKEPKEIHPSSASVKLSFRLRGSPRKNSVSLLKLKQFYYDAFTKGTQVSIYDDYVKGTQIHKKYLEIEFV